MVRRQEAKAKLQRFVGVQEAKPSRGLLEQPARGRNLGRGKEALSRQRVRAAASRSKVRAGESVDGENGEDERR